MNLIAGIDPGTTVGYALLDLKGNIILVDSKRELSNDELVGMLHAKGTVLLAGTDKQKVPGFVQEAATKLGARAVSPPADLLQSEKRCFVSQHTADDHQHDALASAMFAYRQFVPLIKKIEKAVADNVKYEQLLFSGDLVMKRTANLSSIVPVPGEVLFVDNPKVWSEKAVNALRESVSVVVSGTALYSEEERKIPFVVLNSKTLGVRFVGKYAVVGKRQLEQSLASRQVLKKIIDEYRQSRLCVSP